jgi:hypothetical protein
MVVTVGERRYSSYSFLTSALDGGEWSASCPAFVGTCHANTILSSWNTFHEKSNRNTNFTNDTFLHKTTEETASSSSLSTLTQRQVANKLVYITLQKVGSVPTPLSNNRKAKPANQQIKLNVSIFC